MRNFEIERTLSDERCGLFFLAGLDDETPDRPFHLVTIHAVEGALTTDQVGFIERSFASQHPRHRVRLRFHSSKHLSDPRSLEAFADRFRHDRILGDPTGSFASVSQLLNVARLIRHEFDGSISRILWQPDISTLTVLSFVNDGAASDRSTGQDVQERLLQTLVDDHAGDELRKVLRSVRVRNKAPVTGYTPVDDASIVLPSTVFAKPGFWARVSSLAALIGLGSLSLAHAAVPLDEKDPGLPGIAGLVGLTTLGENSYGVRNRFQAVGGLRLYFGETGTLIASALAPKQIPKIESKSPSSQGKDGKTSTWPKPSRIVYGG